MCFAEIFLIDGMDLGHNFLQIPLLKTHFKKSHFLFSKSGFLRKTSSQKPT